MPKSSRRWMRRIVLRRGRDARHRARHHLAMRPRPYPPIEPYATGMLDVGDGQSIYWEVSGNPDGKPAVALHGGPGSGSSPGRRRWFDPGRYRLVQFDQRGCGRSTPHAGDLVDRPVDEHDPPPDRRHRAAPGAPRDRALAGLGRSWGVTLALAYAERFPERVTEMVLLSITLTRRADVHWFGARHRPFFPEEWARFRAGAPEAERDGDLVAAYDRLLNGTRTRRSASRRPATGWPGRTRSCRSRRGTSSPNPRWADERYMIAFARLVTHYFSHAAWLEEDELLRNAPRLAGIPGVLLHGRLDLSGPPDVAWQLARAWPGAELHFIPGGHTGDAEMDRLLLEATDRFATAGDR